MLRKKEIILLSTVLIAFCFSVTSSAQRADSKDHGDLATGFFDLPEFPPPENVTASFKDAQRHQLEISWSKPESSNVVEYRIELCYSDVCVVHRRDNATFLFQIDATTSLRFYTNYTVNVFAVYSFKNASVNSEKAGQILIETGIGKPGPVTDLEFFPTTTNITLMWKPPTEEERRGPIYKYIIEMYCIRNDSRKVCDRQDVDPSNTTVNQFTFTNLTPYTEYIFSIYALNFFLNDQISGLETRTEQRTSPGAPSPVRNLTVQFFRITKAFVQWMEPSEKNGPLNGYLITVRSEACIRGVVPCIEPDIVNVTSIDLHGFEPSTFYIFEVKARNLDERGESIWSEPTVKNVTSPSFAPPVPIGFKIDEIYSDSATLVWKENTSPEFLVSHYLICTDPCDEEKTIKFGETIYNYDNLTPYTNYSFYLKACNGKYCSDKAVITGQTPVSAPGKPKNFTAKLTTSPGTIALFWQQPDLKNGPLDGYQVRWFTNRTSQENNNLWFQDSNVTFPVNITNLTMATKYTFQVRAFNLGGPDAEPLFGDVANTTLTTDIKAPPVPTGFKIDEIYSDSATLVWKENTSPEFLVSHYLICTDPCDQEKIIKFGETIYNYDNLTPYTNYSFYLKACNGKYCSDKAVITGQTPVSAPGEPKNFTAKLTTSPWTVALFWKQPDLKNGPLDGYQVRWFTNRTPQESNYLWFQDSNVTFPVNITNLTMATEYTFQVRAFNLGGPGAEDLFGDIATATLTTDIKAPPNPKGLKTKDVVSDYAFLTWDLEEDSRFIVNFYRATWNNISVQANSTSCLITPLTPWTNYTVTVVACYNKDLCSNGTTISFMTPVAVPGIPKDFAALQPPFPGTISLFWDKPETTNGPIDGYQIKWYLTKATSEKINELQVPGTNDTYNVNINNLMMGTEYTFQVRAFNLEGPNAPPLYGDFANDTITVEKIVPDSPDPLFAIPTSPSSIFVNWTAPSSQKGPFGGYTVFWKISNAEDTSENDTSELSYTIQGLSQDTEYYIAVKGFNLQNKTKLYGLESVVSVRTWKTEEKGSNLKVLLPAILIPMLLIITIAAVVMYYMRKGYRPSDFFHRTDQSDPYKWSFINKVYSKSSPSDS